MKSESCESKVNNLLARLDNLPHNDWNGKIEVLVECLELQAEEIEGLKRKVQK